MSHAAVKREQAILIVDDDPDLLEVFTELLQLKGHTVLTACNGAEALSVLAAAKPCLVLLDLMMPVMTGWEFLQAWKNDASLPRVPIVVLSAVGHDKPEGAATTLLKPVDIEKLWNLVEQYC